MGTIQSRDWPWAEDEAFHWLDELGGKDHEDARVARSEWT